jgi:hemolysin III
MTKMIGGQVVKVKPRFRGVSHLVGFVASLFGFLLLATAPTTGTQYLAGLVYGFGQSAMLGLSALYHVPMWSPRARAVLRRVDHSGIFLQIAGTFTPVAVLHAHGQWSPWLTVMWTGGALGMLFMVVFSNAPRALRTAIYVVLGLIALPVVLELPSLIGAWRVAGLLVGAAIYIIGAVVYARRWPNPDPRLFGYHEVFHVMVIVAAAMHFAVVVDLQRHLA